MKGFTRGLGAFVLALITTVAFAQDGGLSKLDVGAVPRVYADSISNLGANTVTGPAIYVGDADYAKNLLVAAYRVGAATNGVNVLLDYSPDNSTWLTGTTVFLDSVGTALEIADTGPDSVYVRLANYVRARLTGLTGTNDTTDVWYWVKIP